MMSYLLVVIAVTGMLAPTPAVAQDRSASLMITDTKLQTVTCDADYEHKDLIAMNLMDSAGNPTFLASVSPSSSGGLRNSLLNKTLAVSKMMTTTTASSSNNNNGKVDTMHMTIILAKTSTLNLDYDSVVCQYNIAHEVQPRESEATFRQYPAKKLEYTIPLPPTDPSSESDTALTDLLSSSSVRIEVEADGKLYEFDSSTQRTESLEVYLGSTSEEGKTVAARPPVLYLWRKPKRKDGEAGAFSLVVYAPNGSALALNARRFSCLLRFGHASRTSRCSAAQAATEWPHWTPLAIGLAVGLGFFVLTTIGLIIFIISRRPRREPYTEKKVVGEAELQNDIQEEPQDEMELLCDTVTEFTATDQELNLEPTSIQATQDEQPADIHCG